MFGNSLPKFQIVLFYGLYPFSWVAEQTWSALSFLVVAAAVCLGDRPWFLSTLTGAEAPS
jgi:hypothetical protein